MKLKEWLIQANVRPSRFALEIGISPATISAYLNGKSGITLETAKIISKGTYGAVTLEDLATDTQGNNGK